MSGKQLQHDDPCMLSPLSQTTEQRCSLGGTFALLSVTTVKAYMGRHAEVAFLESLRLDLLVRRTRNSYPDLVGTPKPFYDNFLIACVCDV